MEKQFTSRWSSDMSEWLEGKEPKKPKGVTPGHRWWWREQGWFVIKNNSEEGYYVCCTANPKIDWQPGRDGRIGPFPTLESAKAAMLVLGG